jgi:HK97 family phage portal protein
MNITGKTKEIQYLNPNTIKPKLTPRDGLTGFTRRFKGQEKHFDVEDIIYFWYPDPEVEVGPPGVSPAMAALNAADVLLSVDEFMAAFFKRGAIKPTILGVPGGTPKSEKEKLEGWFNRMFSGIANAFKTKAINADAVQVTTIGDGIQDLDNNELTDSRRQDIAAALGVPETKLFQAANFATKERDDKGFYEDTILPEANFIAEVLNEQVFGPNGYQLRFMPEQMQIFQEDERERSEAFANYVYAGMQPSIAAEMLGLSLPQNVEYADLDGAQPEQEQREPQDTDGLRSHLDKWRRKALNSLDRNGVADCEFESKHIPASMNGAIEGMLRGVGDDGEVKAIFDAVERDLPLPFVRDNA